MYRAPEHAVKIFFFKSLKHYMAYFSYKHCTKSDATGRFPLMPLMSAI